MGKGDNIPVRIKKKPGGHSELGGKSMLDACSMESEWLLQYKALFHYKRICEFFTSLLSHTQFHGNSTWGSSPAMSQSIYTISYAWLILAMLSGQACLRGCRTKKWQIHKYSTAKLPTRIQFTYMYISLTNLVIMVLNLERIQVLIYTRNGSDLVLEHTVKVRGFSKQISLQLPIIRLFPIEGAMSHSSQWKCKCP